ncbi:MAG: type II toxin-antitoxin system RelE/ParE family toxin [Gammaproteobacteria bacterium]|nr:type II toxin-antitoxin system RelE/ParE family toxin [Gammaproteobacteria bacterium]
MRNVIIRKEAESDITDAYRWYEDKNPGLGGSFIQCVEDALSRLSFNPNIYAYVHKNIRRSFIRKFPFGIYYLTENDMIIVMAVMHVRKDPKHWQRRT